MLADVRAAGDICRSSRSVHRGELREAGSHQELLARRGLYERLYQLQYRDQAPRRGSAGLAGEDEDRAADREVGDAQGARLE